MPPHTRAVFEELDRFKLEPDKLVTDKSDTCLPLIGAQRAAILGGWSAGRSATWKAAENDCLERRNSIRPRVPSHVAYKAERGGNEPFWSPWKNVSTRVSAAPKPRGNGVS